VTTRESAADAYRRRQYQFGDFVLDLDTGFLRRNGQDVPLRPKSFEVLTYLVVHHGKLVTKNELVEAVWPDTAVTDNSLSQCLFEIRRALDDDSQTAIRTVARRGYVFDMPVSIVFGSRQPMMTTSQRPAARSRRWIVGGVVWAVVIRPQNPNGVGTTSLAFMSLRGETSFDVCNDDCSVGPRSFLVVPPFSWNTEGTRMFVNLTHFGQGTPRTVVLPYRSDVSPAALWPKGLRLEKDVMANPGVKVINAQNTFPASDAAAYLSWRGSTQSNLYRVRIPD
jgi:DNA-binding winged helix-turn-helix (wHTH) protein